MKFKSFLAHILNFVFVSEAAMALSAGAKESLQQLNTSQAISNTQIYENPIPLAPLHRFDVMLAPIPAIFSALNLDLGIRLNKNFAVGPAFEIYQGDRGGLFFPGLNGFGYGASASYYFSGANQNTFYLGLRGYQESYRSHGDAQIGYSENSGQNGSLIAGWQSHSRNFLMRIGLGAEAIHRTSVTYDEFSQVKRTFEYNEIWPDIEFKLGFEFL